MRALALRWTAATALAVAAMLPASAQMLLPAYGANGAPMANFIATSSLLQQAAINASRTARQTDGKRPAKSGTAALTFVPKQAPVGPKLLAAAYPPAVRPEAEKLFAQVLEQYHQIESKFGIPRYDLGGALAAFVAGNLVAYRDEPFPDALFLPLVRQMRDAIQQTTAIRKSTSAEQQILYEQLAIVGTFMAISREGLQRGGDPSVKANLRRAAAGYLDQWLKTEPDRIRMTAAGLAFD